MVLFSKRRNGTLAESENGYFGNKRFEGMLRFEKRIGIVTSEDRKVKTEIAEAFDRKSEIKELFTEYTKMLVDGDSKFKEYLDIQNYDEEIEHLEKKYGPPGGRLYIAYVDSQPAGCIGLRRINDESCEIKRLYVRPEFRRAGLGRLLVERIIRDAKTEGYRCILLDTLPFLESAMRLYKAYGFYEIESYNDSPLETSIFMRMDIVK